jgi:replication factor C subunit 3/5
MGFYLVMYFYFDVLLNRFQAGSRSIDLELTTLSSANHIEMTPSDAGFQDRYIVQEIIKEMAKNRPIDTKGKKGFKGK